MPDMTFTMEENEHSGTVTDQQSETSGGTDVIMNKIKSNNQQLIEKENRLSDLLDQYKQRIEQNKKI